jgi:site-specific recombinase XerD
MEQVFLPVSFSRVWHNTHWVCRLEVGDEALHTFRHMLANHLVMGGIDLATVKELLGHSAIMMTMRYAHLSQDHKIEAVRKLPY